MDGPESEQRENFPDLVEIRLFAGLLPGQRSQASPSVEIEKEQSVLRHLRLILRLQHPSRHLLDLCRLLRPELQEERHLRGEAPESEAVDILFLQAGPDRAGDEKLQE